MPGLALFFARDGSPVDADRVAAMADRLAYRGTRSASWISGPIAIVQIGSPASFSFEVAGSHDGSWRVAFDGRIDNRDDLARELHVDVADGGDAVLAADACERWGAGAASRLCGDFALAAWHARDRRVVLIRDVRGLRPLYYRLDDRELCCASDLRALVLDRDASVNENMVAEWLTGSPVSHRETLFAGVERLPMAHAAVIDERTAVSSQYWTPAIDPRVAGRSEDERAAALAEMLAEAVGDRCGSRAPVGVLLSGGLDSSSVAATVARRGPEWRAFTLAAERPDEDETPMAEMVARHLGSAHTIVRARPVALDDAASDAAFSLDIPSPPNGLQSIALRRAVAAAGYPVALSGLGSDEWFGGSFLVYADLARHGAFVDLARTVWADRQRDEPTRTRLQIAAWALCPPAIKQTIRRVLGRPHTPALVSPALARRTSLPDRLRAEPIAAPALPSFSQQALYRETTCGAYVAATEMQERGNARAGLDERYPFHDRRLIEFSLALPESDRWAGGRYKGILRRAMAGRLPPAVIERQHSPDANAVLTATLRTAGRAFFSRLAIADAGWVDGPRVLDAWDLFERRALGGRTGAEAWELWAVAAVELWWTQAVQRSAAARPGGRTSVA